METPNILASVAPDMKSPDIMLRALCELKSQGAGGLVLEYGEAAGVDDLGVAAMDRNIRISWTPHGAVAGTVVAIWQGKLGELAAFDFVGFPVVLTYKQFLTLAPDRPGFYLHGPHEAIDFFTRQGTLDYRKWEK